MTSQHLKNFFNFREAEILMHKYFSKFVPAAQLSHLGRQINSQGSLHLHMNVNKDTEEVQEEGKWEKQFILFQISRIVFRVVFFLL